MGKNAVESVFVSHDRSLSFWTRQSTPDVLTSETESLRKFRPVFLRGDDSPERFQKDPYFLVLVLVGGTHAGTMVAMLQSTQNTLVDSVNGPPSILTVRIMQ
jgi:hypothetical protein